MAPHTHRTAAVGCRTGQRSSPRQRQSRIHCGAIPEKHHGAPYHDRIVGRGHESIRHCCRRYCWHHAAACCCMCWWHHVTTCWCDATCCCAGLLGAVLLADVLVCWYCAGAPWCAHAGLLSLLCWYAGVPVCPGSVIGVWCASVLPCASVRFPCSQHCY